MPSKVSDTPEQTGLDWQMEEDLGDNFQTDNCQMDTQNSQVNKFYHFYSPGDVNARH